MHQEKLVAPKEDIPQASRFRGYRDFVVQDLQIRAHKLRYRLQRWEMPDGQSLVGRLSPELEGHPF
jgi:hypothetical protein